MQLSTISLATILVLLAFLPSLLVTANSSHHTDSLFPFDTTTSESSTTTTTTTTQEANTAFFPVHLSVFYTVVNPRSKAFGQIEIVPHESIPQGYAIFLDLIVPQINSDTKPDEIQFQAQAHPIDHFQFQQQQRQQQPQQHQQHQQHTSHLSDLFNDPFATTISDSDLNSSLLTPQPSPLSRPQSPAYTCPFFTPISKSQSHADSGWDANLYKLFPGSNFPTQLVPPSTFTTCMMYETNDVDFENPTVAGYLTTERCPVELRLSKTIPAHYRIVCPTRLPDKSPILTGHLIINGTNPSMNCFNTTTKEPVYSYATTEDPYFGVEISVEYKAGVIAEGTREDRLILNITGLPPSMMLPFDIGLDVDGLLRFDRLNVLSKDDQKLIARYWAVMNEDIADPAKTADGEYKLPPAHCGQDVQLIFFEGFHIFTRDSPAQAVVCEIPIPIFDIMRTMVNLPTLDYSVFNHRKIAPFIKLQEFRLIQGINRSTDAIWDFTNKYLTNVEIVTNHQIVNWVADKTDLHYNTMLFHYDVIITGKLPSFRVNRLLFDPREKNKVDSPASNDSLSKHDDDGRTLFDQIFDDDGYLVTFQYNTSPVHSWQPVKNAHFHKKLTLDTDYKTALSENYHGFANVTLVFEIELYRIAPFVIEVEINDSLHYLEFLPDVQATWHIERTEVDLMTIVSRFSYLDQKVVNVPRIGRDPEPPSDFTLRMNTFQIRHDLSYKIDKILPFEIRDTDQYLPTQCYGIYFDEHGKEAQALVPYSMEKGINEEIAQVFSKDFASWIEFYNIALLPNWTFQIKCDFKVNEVIEKPPMNFANTPFPGQFNILSRFSSPFRTPYWITPKMHSIMPTWKQVGYTDDVIFITVHSIDPIRNQEDLNSVKKQVAEIFIKAERPGNGFNSIFTTFSETHLMYQTEHLYSSSNGETCFQYSLEFPSYYQQKRDADSGHHPPNRYQSIFSLNLVPNAARLNFIVRPEDVTGGQYTLHASNEAKFKAFQDLLDEHSFYSQNGVVIQSVGVIFGNNVPLWTDIQAMYPNPVTKVTSANGNALGAPTDAYALGYPVPSAAPCTSTSDCDNFCVEGRCLANRDDFLGPAISFANYYKYSRLLPPSFELKPAPTTTTVSRTVSRRTALVLGLISKFSFQDVDAPGGVPIVASPNWLLRILILIISSISVLIAGLLLWFVVLPKAKALIAAHQNDNFDEVSMGDFQGLDSNYTNINGIQGHESQDDDYEDEDDDEDNDDDDEDADHHNP